MGDKAGRGPSTGKMILKPMTKRGTITLAQAKSAVRRVLGRG